MRQLKACWPSSFEELLARELERTPEEREEHQRNRDLALQEQSRNRTRQQMLEIAKKASSSLGPRFTERTLNSYKIPPGDRKALDVALEIVDEPERGGWFFGNVGNGKTHVVAGIVNACTEKLVPASFTSVLDLLDRLKRSYDRSDRVKEGEYDIIAALARVPVLVLDDLDKAEFTKWASQRLYALINRRYENNLPLIVTSNASPADVALAWLKAGLDEHIADAVMDRIREMCDTLLHVNGESQRGNL